MPLRQQKKEIANFALNLRVRILMRGAVMILKYFKKWQFLTDKSVCCFLPSLAFSSVVLLLFCSGLFFSFFFLSKDVPGTSLLSSLLSSPSLASVSASAMIITSLLLPCSIPLGDAALARRNGSSEPTVFFFLPSGLKPL